MELKRVVVTGLGLVSPLADGVDATWRRLLAGESGARQIEKFDTTQLPCKIAAEVPRRDGNGGGAAAGGDAFNPDDYVDARDQRRIDDFIVYGIAAADQAIKASGIDLSTRAAQERTGVLCGAGIGGLG
ncbi:MAG: beta-ketoacyl synthase N-terminal-like domain-containing protein, partial [Pseudomonadota bacterium]